MEIGRFIYLILLNMSVVFTNCISCATAGLAVEDLLRKAFVCDSEGNSYIRTYSQSDVSGASQFCGLIADYVIETKTINGVDHLGIIVTHSLNKTTGLFLTVTDGDSITQNGVSAEIIDANNIFIMLDGLENGGFCVS